VRGVNSEFGVRSSEFGVRSSEFGIRSSELPLPGVIARSTSDVAIQEVTKLIPEVITNFRDSY